MSIFTKKIELRIAKYVKGKNMKEREWEKWEKYPNML